MSGRKARRVHDGGSRPIADVFCLPYAGAPALALREVASRIAPGFRVTLLDYPGHGQRRGERPLDSIRAIAQDLLEVCLPTAPIPPVFFGHSMGSLVALELTRLLKAGGCRPGLVVASGHRAPHLPSRFSSRRNLTDGELAKELQSLGGTPTEVAGDSELMGLILPAVRADLTACETYVFQPDVIDVPLVVYGGLTDLFVRHDELAAWSQVATQPPRIRMFPGGHFFLNEAPALVAEALMRDISEAAPGALQASLSSFAAREADPPLQRRPRELPAFLAGQGVDGD